MTETHPQNRRLGYARVTTYGQTLDAQLEQLRGAGCSKICRETRAQLRRGQEYDFTALTARLPGTLGPIIPPYRCCTHFRNIGVLR